MNTQNTRRGFTQIQRVGQTLPDNAPAKGHLAAFTLIEFLVVVLIIGILAAVAIPQYQKAVGVSHIKALFPIARSVLEAERRFYLANGYYTGNLNRLDITPTQGCYENGYRCFYGKVTIQGNTTDSPADGLIVSEDGFPPLYLWLQKKDLCCLARDSSDNKNHTMCKQAMQPLSRTTPITGATYYCIKIP